MQATASIYETFNLGRQRPGDMLPTNSIFQYCFTQQSASKSTATGWHDSFSSACKRLICAAPSAIDDLRYIPDTYM